MGRGPREFRSSPSPSQAALKNDDNKTTKKNDMWLQGGSFCVKIICLCQKSKQTICGFKVGHLGR